MFQAFDGTSTKDLSSDRVFNLDNNKLHIRKSDPYGFWTVSYERGQVPESIGGQYTSPMEAEKAVLTYLAAKGKEVKSTSK